MINKIVQHLTDAAWDIISAQEKERLYEATKSRAPQYECSVQVEV